MYIQMNCHLHVHYHHLPVSSEFYSVLLLKSMVEVLLPYCCEVKDSRIGIMGSA